MSKLEDMAWNQESFRTSAILWQVKLFEAIIVVVVVVVVIVIIIIISSSTSRSQQLSPWRGPESSPWLHLGSFPQGIRLETCHPPHDIPCVESVIVQPSFLWD